MINNNLYYRFIECGSDKKWFNRRSRVQLDDVEAAAGILKDGLIMIDTDTDRDSELLLLLIDMLGVKCNIVRTLNGIHAIFKKPDNYYVKSDSKMETVTGIIVDVKQGRNDRQKSDLDIVKRYGEEMETIQYCEDPDELPWQLRVFSNKLNLQQVGEGDGRHSMHQRLFARWQEYVNSDAAEALKWVNWVNTYVFDVPRKSINWTEKQVQQWYDTHPILSNGVPRTREDVIKLLEDIEPSEMNKIYSYVLTNYDRKDK